MNDLFLTILPRYVHASDPPAGVAIIAGCARNAGYQVITDDFNLILYKKLKDNKKIFREIDEWMVETPICAININREQDWRNELSNEASEELDKIFEIYLEKINLSNAKFLGFGLFSRNSRKIARVLIPMIKTRFPEKKIILGGAGTQPFQEDLYNMVDFYVQGEGENAINDILSGNHERSPGVNKNPVEQIQDLDSLPWPDYSTFPLNEYMTKIPKLRITGSRGCTRRCNFCNVYTIWPKYIHRSGKNIAEEIIYQHTTLPNHPEQFIFTDSLLNGNIKQMREMCNSLIEKKKEWETQGKKYKIKFEGQSIAIGEKSMSPSDFELLREAGCTRLYFGLETANEKLRYKMNKKFTNEAMNYYVQQCKKNNIKQIWFILVGHPFETEEMFMDTVNFFKKYSWMNEADYQIETSIHEFTPMEEVNFTQEHIEHFYNDDAGYWMFKGHEDVNREERLSRVLFLENKIHKWGYNHRQPTLLQYDNMSLEQLVNEIYGEEVSKKMNFEKYRKLLDDSLQHVA